MKKLFLFAAVGLSLTLGACSEKSSNERSKSETQVVAKVNGDEISVHQLNLQLGRLGALDEAAGKKASEQILVKLVDQQLLTQEAKKEKLDRDPRILQLMEASKNEILAQAYLEQLASKVNKPTEAEIEEFYQGHPELFGNRKLFRLQELVILDKEKFSEIEAAIKPMQQINEIAKWLSDNRIAFNANSNVRAAEQLPGNLLQQLQPRKEGEFVIVKTDNSMNIVYLAATQAASITLEKAKPIIEQYYLNQSKAKMVRDEMAKLRQQAEITFVGAFSEMKMPSNDVNKDAKPLTEKPKEAQTSSQDNEKNAIEKGLAGM